MSTDSAIISPSADAFRLLIENADDFGLISFCTESLVTRCNRGFETITGYRSGELVGRRCAALQEIVESLRLMFQSHEPFSNAIEVGETQIVRKDGRLLWVKWTATPIRDYGESVGIAITLRDIDTKVRADEITRSNRDFERAVLDTINAQIAVLDPTGVIVSTNRAWRESMPSLSILGGDYRHARLVMTT